MSTAVEDLLAERRYLNKQIRDTRNNIKHELLCSNTIRAQIELNTQLKAQQRIRQINFELSTAYFQDEINRLEYIINEQSRI